MRIRFIILFFPIYSFSQSYDIEFRINNHKDWTNLMLDQITPWEKRNLQPYLFFYKEKSELVANTENQTIAFSPGITFNKYFGQNFLWRFEINHFSVRSITNIYDLNISTGNSYSSSNRSSFKGIKIAAGIGKQIFWKKININASAVTGTYILTESEVVAYTFIKDTSGTQHKTYFYAYNATYFIITNLNLNISYKLFEKFYLGFETSAGIVTNKFQNIKFRTYMPVFIIKIPLRSDLPSLNPPKKGA